MGRPDRHRADIPEAFRVAVLAALAVHGAGARMASRWGVDASQVTRRKRAMAAGAAPLQHWLDAAEELGVPVPPEARTADLDELDRAALEYAATARQLDDERRTVALEALRASRAILEERIASERAARTALDAARRGTDEALALAPRPDRDTSRDPS